MKYLTIALVIILSSCHHKKEKPHHKGKPTIKIPLKKGPFQNNGASPWYAELALGTPGQKMKFGMDTGNNANWVTSVQCSTYACTEDGRIRFNMGESTSFEWVSTETDTLAFGPWGKMAVNIGSDYFTLNGTQLDTKTKSFLSIHYDSINFEELDWDGGIGFPSQLPDQRTSFFLEQIVNSGMVNPENLMVSFYANTKTGEGEIMIGDYHQSKVVEDSKLVFPFQTYTEFDGELKYLWTTPIETWSIGDSTVATDKIFAFDTGASDFKGDTVIMNNALSKVFQYYDSTGNYPYMEIIMGVDKDGIPGKLALNPDQYVAEIEAGPDKGKRVVSIEPLEMKNLILAGSILLQYVYPVFVYEVTGEQGDYQLGPKEVWLFNLKDGPQVIQ